MTDIAATPSRPLAGLKVLDFSNLLPGPMATLVLAEAGAEVIKIERPGIGDEMRVFEPLQGGDGVQFAVLNRGKTSRFLDLKNADDLAEVRALAEAADILIDQFRPGVMARLGLGYDVLSALNPGLIYCSITGYGQSGPNAQRAAHDVNYLAETGMLSLVAEADGTPSLPPFPVADVAGGAYPALINILIALHERTRTGKGRYLDVSMTDNIFALMSLGWSDAVSGQAKPANQSLITGGSPRYGIYRTSDDRFISAAPIEPRFWSNFCAAMGLPESADRAAVAARFATRTADDWMAHFGTQDVLCAIVRTVNEAREDPHFVERGLFDHAVSLTTGEVPALPTPLVADYRDPQRVRPMPPAGAR